MVSGENVAVRTLFESLILVGERDIPDVHAQASAIEAGIPDARRV
jgi:hypothetical protein